MRVSFPSWSDTAFRIALLAMVALPLALVSALLIWVRTPYYENRGYVNDQPVQFDHRHHVADDGIDCLYCHGDALRSKNAGVPSTELCMGCHAQVWPASIALEPVRRSYYSGVPLHWNRVHKLADYVYFDHSIHVNKGVGCSSCHGRVDQMALDYQVAPLTMGWCLECHRDPEPRIRPFDEITSMTWKPRAHDDPEGRALVERYDVQKKTNCTTCHR
ncbi:MAG: cytochrome c3 family protein [Polyangia bacterium]